MKNFSMLAALSLVVAGCASLPEAVFGIDNADMPAESVAGVTTHDVFIATTRHSDPDAAVMYSGERGAGLSLARVTVSIPPSHVPGKIERPTKLPPDPRREFAILNPVKFGNDETFIANINQELEERNGTDRELLLFVHGYNTTPAAAVMRIAQFVEDSKFAGIPVLFSWASRGKTVDYVYDMNSALQARNAFIDTAQILSKTNADSFAILAHSMGNLLTVEAIRQAKLQGQYNRNGKLKTVILASPDIDIDLFKQQISSLREEERNFFILISKDDKALAVSRKIAGGVNRVGDAQPSDLAGTGVTVIDLSEIDNGRSLGHSKFADVPELVKLIGLRLNAGDQLGTASGPANAQSVAGVAPDLTIRQNQANVFTIRN